MNTHPDHDEFSMPENMHLKFNPLTPMAPLKAIRLKCLDCSGDSWKEVEQCPVDCPLLPFRFGTNPFRVKRELTDAQKQELSARLHQSR